MFNDLKIAIVNVCDREEILPLPKSFSQCEPDFFKRSKLKPYVVEPKKVSFQFKRNSAQDKKYIYACEADDE